MDEATFLGGCIHLDRQRAKVIEGDAKQREKQKLAAAVKVTDSRKALETMNILSLAHP